MRNNRNVWHKPNYEYGFEDGDNQYRIFTDANNTISVIWMNGKSIESDGIALEIEGNDVFKYASIYAAYDVNDTWNENELARVRNLQKKRS